MIRIITGLLALLLLVTPATARECNIMGNVNTRGERIYHVLGQKYYDATVISRSHGERWFCTEAETRAPGELLLLKLFNLIGTTSV